MKKKYIGLKNKHDILLTKNIVRCICDADSLLLIVYRSLQGKITQTLNLPLEYYEDCGKV